MAEKSQSQEKNTRVKARVKAHALRELIETREQVFIMGHKIGDVDSLGAGIGIYRACSELSKKAHIVLDDVTSSVRPIQERFLNNPDYAEDMFIRGDKAISMALSPRINISEGIKPLRWQMPIRCWWWWM